MFEKFMCELRVKANENNLDADTIVLKYEKRYKLAIEAGFTEQEAVEKFGNVDDIIAFLADELKEKEQSVTADSTKKMELLQIDGVYSGDVIIRGTDKPGITYTMDKALEECYEVKSTDKEFTISCAKEKKLFKKHRGDMEISINHDLFFEKIKFDVVAADVDVSKYDIHCDEFILSTVNGDVTVNLIESLKNVDISVVSGDVIIKKINTPTAKMSSVSGDINIEEVDINRITCSTVSGDITIDSGFNQMIEGSSISGDIIFNSKKVGKNLADSFNEIGDSISKMKF